MGSGKFFGYSQVLGHVARRVWAFWETDPAPGDGRWAWLLLNRYVICAFSFPLCGHLLYVTLLQFVHKVLSLWFYGAPGCVGSHELLSYLMFVET